MNVRYFESTVQTFIDRTSTKLADWTLPAPLGLQFTICFTTRVLRPASGGTSSWVLLQTDVHMLRPRGSTLRTFCTCNKMSVFHHSYRSPYKCAENTYQGNDCEGDTYISETASAGSPESVRMKERSILNVHDHNSEGTTTGGPPK